jgi:leader peptidase (prepilin peptidase)/N-methyltransferase
VSPALVVTVSAAVAGLLGLLVPRAVAALPEPERSEAAPGEDPKPLYVDVAARPGLAWWAAGASAVSAAIVALALGDELWLVALVPLVPVCVTLAVVDWHTRLLPSRLVLPATAYAVVVALVLWPVTGSADDLVRAAIGLAVARGFFWLLWFIHAAGMGFGDVRLAALLGIALGYLGWAELLTGIYSGFLVFGLPGLLLALVRWDRSLLKTAFPFGPFMLGGALIGLLCGPWVAAYLAWR